MEPVIAAHTTRRNAFFHRWARTGAGKTNELALRCEGEENRKSHRV
jgi:hypothetical protein